jgi:sigma-B regulation protein RsbU (phosphoserine phosphatase)
MPLTRTTRANLTAATYESHFEHKALFEFSKVINSSLDLRFILSHILLTIMGKILSTKGMVVLEKAKGKYAIEMVKGFPAELQNAELTIKRIPQSLFHVDKLRASQHPWLKPLKKHGVRILLPMFIADRPIGFLGFGERFSAKKLSTMEETYLRSLANISATAVEKSRTIIELQQVNRKLDRKIQELNTLFELGKEFGALLDPDKLIRLFVFSLLGQIGVSRYLISLRDRSDMKVAASRLDGPAPQSELLMMLTSERGATRVSDMVVKQAVDVRETLHGLGLHVVVPMQTQGIAKGVVLLGEKLSKEEFNDSDLELVSSLSNLVMISLENARLFQEAIEKQKLEDELLIAREIQKGLLPSVIPTIAGIEIAAVNISSKQVGGDYYDVLPIDNHRYIIAIGDVSGKGTPAALLMANLQATIRALSPLGLPLNEFTQRVNELMCNNTGGNKFVTFFWGIIDESSKAMTYVNAGHNYPFLLHANGSVERLDKGGMILGVMKTAPPYEQETIRLHPGDLLVLFTDGVSEAMTKDSVEYGENRLEELLPTIRHLSAHEITEEIYKDVQRHTKGAPQSDDITMMVVKVS